MCDPVHAVLDALAARGIPVRRDGTGYRFPCPAHGGDGFNVKLDRGGDGRALLYCHSRQCAASEIAAALDLDPRALFPDDGTSRSWSPAPLHASSAVRSGTQLDRALHRRVGPVVMPYGREVARWTYQHADGRIAGHTVGVEPGPDGRSKVVLPFYPDPDGQPDALGRPGRPEALAATPYNLPALRVAVEDGSGEVWIVEGEKCADALIQLGLAATTGQGGAQGAWRTPGCSLALAGVRRAFILPDQDQPGREYAIRAARCLRAHYPDIDVRIVDLPGLGEAEDVVDWLAHGGSLRELRQLVEATAPWLDVGHTAHGEVIPPILPIDTRTSRTEHDDVMPGKPVLDEAALYGPVGSIVRMIEPHTEAHPAALLVGLLTGIAAAVGREVTFTPAAGGQQRVNLYSIFVGPTSRGAKGTATSVVRQVIAELDAEFATRCIASGLRSGEGLVFRVRDADPEQDDAGVLDPRLLLVEEEWGGVLGRSSRDGNSLTAVLREAWDGRPVSTMSRRNPLRATRAHVTVIANITAEELLRRSDFVDFVNGFVNRFVFVYTERARVLPFGGARWMEAIQPELTKLRTTLEVAREMRDFELGMTDAAKAIWAREYERLSDGEGSGTLAALTGRGRQMVLRVAMLLAVVDRQRDIDAAHLLAALAVWRYAVDSVKYVFARTLLSRDALRALDALADAADEGIAHTGWRAVLGSNNGIERRRDEMLAELASLKLIVTRTEATGAGGRPARRTYLARFASAVHPEDGQYGQNGHEPPVSWVAGEDTAQLAHVPITDGESPRGVGGRTNASPSLDLDLGPGGEWEDVP